MTRWLARLVVATLVAATGAVGQAAPAAAALCSAGEGVSVVVDYKSLGGGIVRACASGGGGKAAALSQRAGVALTQAAQEPGFVCRVNNAPASDPCQRASPSNAYWGLYWSTGNGSWTYSSRGAFSQDVPAGGFVGWAFQSGGGSGAPGVSPTAPAAPAPKPTPKPAPKPTPAPKPAPAPAEKPAAKPSAAPTAGGSTGSGEGQSSDEGSGTASGKASATASSRASATASAKASERASERASDRASERASEEASASSGSSPGDDGSPADETDGDADAAISPSSSQVGDSPDGLPLWLPLGVVLLLAAGGGGAVWWRRRNG